MILLSRFLRDITVLIILFLILFRSRNQILEIKSCHSGFVNFTFYILVRNSDSSGSDNFYKFSSFTQFKLCQICDLLVYYKIRMLNYFIWYPEAANFLIFSLFVLFPAFAARSLRSWGWGSILGLWGPKLRPDGPCLALVLLWVVDYLSAQSAMPFWRWTDLIIFISKHRCRARKFQCWATYSVRNVCSFAAYLSP